MSSGGALRWVAGRLPGMNDEVRVDLVETIGRTAHRASRRARVAETVSLVGFALQYSSRRGTGDHRAQMLRQGARIAALALAATFTAAAWTQGAVLPALAGAAAVVLVSTGLRWAAVAPCIAGLFSAANTSTELLALGVVVLVVVAVGEPFDRRFCPIGGLLGGLGVALGAGTAALAPDVVLPVISGAGLVVMAVFLLVGWADPRFAVAATILCASRFVTPRSTRFCSRTPLPDLGHLADTSGPNRAETPPAVVGDTALRHRWTAVGLPALTDPLCATTFSHCRGRWARRRPQLADSDVPAKPGRRRP